jgi:two-component system, OmpR family, KDP operon response regulator KdpE
MKMTKILVIEDEVSIRKFLKLSLESNLFDLVEATNGAEGLAMAGSHRPDVILVDIGLPDMNGFDVIKKIREWSSIPIIVLTVHDREEEKVQALDLGADDYVTKPFGVPELLARIRVVLRRSSGDQERSPVFRSGSFEMDRAAHLVKVFGKEVHLTSTEYDLLAVLVKHAGKVVTHRTLLKEVWGPNSVDHVQYLRVYMGQIRKKLKIGDEAPEVISTEPGVGYRFLLEA